MLGNHYHYVPPLLQSLPGFTMCHVTDGIMTSICPLWQNWHFWCLFIHRSVLMDSVVMFSVLTVPSVASPTDRVDRQLQGQPPVPAGLPVRPGAEPGLPRLRGEEEGDERRLHRQAGRHHRPQH